MEDGVVVLLVGPYFPALDDALPFVKLGPLPDEGAMLLPLDHVELLEVPPIVLLDPVVGAIPPVGGEYMLPLEPEAPLVGQVLLPGVSFIRPLVILDGVP